MSFVRYADEETVVLAFTNRGHSPVVVVSGNLLISGTAADNLAVQKVEIRLDGGPWVTATGTNVLDVLRAPADQRRRAARHRAEQYSWSRTANALLRIHRA